MSCLKFSHSLSPLRSFRPTVGFLRHQKCFEKVSLEKNRKIRLSCQSQKMKCTHTYVYLVIIIFSRQHNMSIYIHYFTQMSNSTSLKPNIFFTTQKKNGTDSCFCSALSELLSFSHESRDNAQYQLLLHLTVNQKSFRAGFSFFPF